jgi:hypothetical protein
VKLLPTVAIHNMSAVIQYEELPVSSVELCEPGLTVSRERTSNKVKNGHHYQIQTSL